MAGSEHMSRAHGCFHAATQICETLVSGAKALVVREHPYFSCGASLRTKSEGWPLCLPQRTFRGAGATNRYVKYDNREAILPEAAGQRK
jgi:hypothetical protein